MKRIHITIIVLATLTASCSKASFWELPNNVRVVAHTESAAASSLVWNASDSITIIDAEGVWARCAIESSGDTYATFYTYEWTGTAPAYAAYPSDRETAQAEGINVVLASEYEVSDMEQCASFAAVGQLEGSRNIYKALPMKNVMGIIKVTLPAGVTSLKLEPVGDEFMAGQVTVDYARLASEDGMFWQPVEGKMSTSVTVTPKEGSNASDAGKFVPGEYYVSVLPQTYASGVRITMNHEDGVPEVVEKKVPVTVSRNSVFDIDDPLPDDIILTLSFLNEGDVNPLGQFIAWAGQTEAGTDYSYTYDYEYNGIEMSYDFIFTVYGGSKYSYEAKAKDIPNKLLYVADGGKWAIRLPAVKGRYLKSVSFTHTGTTYERRFRLQEGYPTPGHYFSATAAPESAVATAVATISIPTGTTDAKMINETKQGTAYYVQLTGETQSYYVTEISVTYTREKPVKEQ